MTGKISSTAWQPLPVEAGTIVLCSDYSEELFRIVLCLEKPSPTGGVRVLVLVGNDVGSVQTMGLLAPLDQVVLHSGGL